ncbi:hypothetical protein BGX30_005311 [Mortierella sp. GBA39]|nr:hypothetical protein BGX30_005311 [Mortierella sp. GBA39]
MTTKGISSVVEVCPKLRYLSKHHVFADMSASMIIAFLQFMPSNTGVLSNQQTRSKELFDGCHFVNAETIVWIIVGCPASEVFRINSFSQSTFTIPSRDLLKEPWDSTKFRELKLHLQLDKVQKASNKEEMIFSDPVPRWMIGLERIFYQLTVLTDLRILDLRVAVERRGDDATISNRNKAFVGMLTLDDRATGLSWLAAVARRTDESGASLRIFQPKCDIGRIRVQATGSRLDCRTLA